MTIPNIGVYEDIAIVVGDLWSVINADYRQLITDYKNQKWSIISDR